MGGSTKAISVPIPPVYRITNVLEIHREGNLQGEGADMFLQ